MTPPPQPATPTPPPPAPPPTPLGGPGAARGPLPRTNPPPEHFADRLEAAIAARGGAPGCVGLDPVLERLPGAIRGSDPVEAITSFCRGVLEAVAPIVPVVKFQSACFERYGSGGVAALRNLVDEAGGMGLLTLVDAKRGDIGITAEHYATALFGEPPADGGLESPHWLGGTDRAADAVTLSPYLGMETIAPFIRPGKGVFVLVRTSNPGGDEVQTPRLADGRTIAEMIADQVAAFGAPHLGDCGLSSVGAVVGLTKAAEGERLRARMPDQVFLVPGYGAQGGTLEDVKRLLRPANGRGGGRGGTEGGRGGTGGGRGGAGGGRGVLVTASRSVIYAFTRGEAGWPSKVAEAARKLQEELGGMMG